MAKKQRLESANRPSPVSGSDDAGLIGNFSVGPAGVGPVMGFGSDDFFPVAPVGDAQTQQSNVGTAELEDAESPTTDQSVQRIADPNLRTGNRLTPRT